MCAHSSEGRLEILKIKTRNMKLAPDMDLALVGKDTHGFVGAWLCHNHVTCHVTPEPSRTESVCLSSILLSFADPLL